MKNILIVCTGNICRSPMAAALLRARLADMGLDEQVQVETAGTHALPGDLATEHAVAVMAERGLDLSRHQAQRATRGLLEAADVVLVMEEGQRRRLFNLAPEYVARIYLLSELSGGHDDIADPIGGDRAGYETAADLVDRLLAAGMPRLLKLLGLPPAS